MPRSLISITPRLGIGRTLKNKAIKNFKNLAIVATALAAVAAVIIYGEMLINIIVPNWSAIVDWLSSVSVITAGISIMLFILSYYLYTIANHNCNLRGPARLIEKHRIKIFLRLNNFGIEDFFIQNVSNVLAVLSVVLFAANTFFLFNHYELLRLWLIILGGAAVLALGIANIFWLCDGDSFYRTLALLAVCILAFTYYLDVFIFSWDRPWITGIAAVLVFAFCMFMIIREQKNTRKEKLEKAESEAKIARTELEKRNQKIEAEKVLNESLRNLSFYDLIVNYFNESTSDNNLFYELFRWEEVHSFYVNALPFAKANSAKADSAKIDEREKIHLAFLFSRKGLNHPGTFLRMAAKIFEANDIEALLFSKATTSMLLPPEAFAQCSCKEGVIAAFLAQNFDEYKKVLHDKVKRQFGANEFYGVVSSLIYSYEKNRGEDTSAKIIKRIEEIYHFANDTLESLWNEGNRKQLRGYLSTIFAYCNQNGVHAKLDTPKQEKVEINEE